MGALRSIFAATLMLSGCLVASGCISPQGMHRTQLDRWSRLTIPELGLSVELPVRTEAGGPQIIVSDLKDEPAVLIRMHLFWNPPFVDSYMQFIIHRLSQERFNRYESGATGGGLVGMDRELGAFGETMRLKEIPAKYGIEMPFLEFRRDYIAPNHDVVLVGGEMWPPLLKDSNPYLHDDKKAVERILNSIQFMK